MATRAAAVVVTKVTRGLVGLLLAVVVLGFLPGRARSEGRVEVHGTYFREASTRIVQPMVQVSTDLPFQMDVGAHALVDAITSASIAQGAAKDEIFTETRKEAGFGVGKSFSGHRRVGLSYRQSREPDYVSHSVGAELGTGVWENSGTLSLRVARSFDVVGLRAGTSALQDDNTFDLNTWFAGLAYEQTVSPTWVVQSVYEVFRQDGYIQNYYQRLPNGQRDSAPRARVRHAAALRTAKYLPATGTGLQLGYRLYFDHSGDEAETYPWGILAHTIDGRIFQQITRAVEIRVGYRYYTQGAAVFWCNTDPTRGGRPDCYGPQSILRSADVKWGELATHLPELKIFYDLKGLSDVPGFRALASGTLDFSYGYLFQDTRYGGAHLLQTGYVLPF